MFDSFRVQIPTNLMAVKGMVRMEKELDALVRDFKMIEQDHGRNVLNLILAVAYLRKLMDNVGVVRFL